MEKVSMQDIFGHIVTVYNGSKDTLALTSGV